MTGSFTLVSLLACNPLDWPLSSPPCLSRHFLLLILFQMDAGGLYVSTGAVSYDALGQRMRVRNIPLVGNQTFKMDLLILFNEVWNLVNCFSNTFQDLLWSAHTQCILTGLLVTETWLNATDKLVSQQCLCMSLYSRGISTTNHAICNIVDVNIGLYSHF